MSDLLDITPEEEAELECWRVESARNAEADRRMFAAALRRKFIALILAILFTLALIGLFLANSSLAPAAFVLALIAWVYFGALITTEVV